MDFVLDPAQLVIIGVIATVLVQLIRWIGSAIGKPVPKVAIQWVVFAISLVLAVFWADFPLPVFPGFGGEPAELVVALAAYAAEWVAIGGQLVGVAHIIYKALGKRFFDAFQPLRL